MQSAMTSFDIAAIVDELDNRLKGAKVINVYHLPEANAVFLRLRLSGMTDLLVLQAARRMCCTDFAIRMPEKPSQFAMDLRRRLAGGIVEGISQIGFDRIASIKLKVGQTHLELLVEMMPRGNILLNEGGVIERVLFRRAMRDRRVARGEAYKPPPSNTIHPDELVVEDMAPLLRSEERMGHLLAKKLGYGPPYADEICVRAGMRPDDVATSIAPSGAGRILESARLVYKLARDRASPRLYRDPAGQLVGFSSFELLTRSGDPSKEYPTMNQLVDDYYVELEAVEARMRREEVSRKEDEMASRATERMRQTAQLMLERAKGLREEGEIIFNNLSDIRDLVDAAKSGMAEARSYGKAKLLEVAGGRERVVRIEVSGRGLELPLRRDPSKTASSLFEEAKRLEGDYGRISGKISAHGKRVKAEGHPEEEATKPERRARKAWYENYKWFTSSDGIMVVCGKDASSNEALIRRYAKSENPIFHSDVSGAPFVLVMSDADATPQGTLDEAAQMAASHTTWAWQAGYASLDVFWVKASQLSKSPPSGEYLTRGSFMVRGKKNYFRGTRLALAVAVVGTGGKIEVVVAPVGAVSSKTATYVVITPGTHERARLASEIKEGLLKLAPEGERAGVRTLRLEEIIAALPAKNAQMTKPIKA